MPALPPAVEQPRMLANPVLSTPTWMAPMQGVGAPLIRDLIAQRGKPGIICTPFVRVTAQPPGIEWIRAQLHRSGDVPLCAQVLGNHAAHLALVARVLEDAGAEVVDLNLGCPTRRAEKKGVGAALLTRFDTIASIVEQMRAACHCTLSVKVRTGDGDAEAVVRVARLVEAAGADILIVHPRTRSQGYEGLADWSAVKRLKSALRIPVVGNGDLWYAGDALRLMQASGADAIMLGRPALRNPFIFRQITELFAGVPPYRPTGKDIVRYIQDIVEHARVELAHRSRGPIGAIKEQIQFVLRAVPEPLRTGVGQRAMHAKTLDDILVAIEPLSDAIELDLTADGPLRFEATPTSPD